MDLIRCKRWGIVATLPASTALKQDFAATLIKYFQDCSAGRGCAELYLSLPRRRRKSEYSSG